MYLTQIFQALEALVEVARDLLDEPLQEWGPPTQEGAEEEELMAPPQTNSLPETAAQES
jgi:hypothetical protein